MEPSDKNAAQRRTWLKAAGALAGTSLIGDLPRAFAQTAKQPALRVGLMLPYTGTYTALGVAIANAFKLAVAEHGGKLGGRTIEYFNVDDESDPSKAPDNASKLVQRDKVDVLVGTVHSGVEMGMVKVARDTNTLLIIPNAGVAAATGALCAPNIFRTSFTNWQPGYAMGKVMVDRKIRSAVTLAWKYGAGEESVSGFKDAFVKAGGKIVKEMWLPFPNVEFQAYLTEIASLKPDAVFVFFAGGGAAKFLKDYHAAGLKGKVPLYASGFLTDGVLEAAGNSADGLETVLHYADGLKLPKNDAFRLAFAKAYKQNADVYAVQGYDAAQLLAIGLDAVKGDLGKRAEMVKAMENAHIDSPRGAWKMSRAHNPIQDMYLRKVVGRENVVTGIAIKGLEDPATGCKMVA